MIDISFTPVSSKKLYLQIYNQILSEIKSGSFKVGDKLPTERELCAQFQVSRAPIRQALSALELNGIIYSRQGEGVYVKSVQSLNEDSKSEALVEGASPEDIVEVRMSIEPYVAKYAAMRATDEDIKKIDLTLSKMEKETAKGIFLSETDDELHKDIARASHNDLFIKFMMDISISKQQQGLWKFIQDKTFNRPEYRDANFSEHKSIIESIRDHNAKEAMKRMNNHMKNLYDRYWKE